MTIGCRSNEIFVEATDCCLDHEIDAIALAGRPLCDERIERTFGGPAGVVRELRRLRQHNRRPEHYRLGAYHNALLHSFMIEMIGSLHDLQDEPLTFADGRYLVAALDAQAFEVAFFPDTDFLLAPAVLQRLDADKKQRLGFAPGVFGVVQALPPHGDELALHRDDDDDDASMQPIVELTADLEARLRRLPAADLADELAALGWLYRRGEIFPFDPPWAT